MMYYGMHQKADVILPKYKFTRKSKEN